MKVDEKEYIDNMLNKYKEMLSDKIASKMQKTDIKASCAEIVERLSKKIASVIRLYKKERLRLKQKIK